MSKGEAHGDWLLVEELFERGDASFVDELRKVDDAERLGGFAGRWFADKRPEARQLLFDYLSRPLNAFRHEALVKRMFKLAEASGDDVLMGHFTVAFDRTIRRVRSRRNHFESMTLDSASEANALAVAWRNQGFTSVNVFQNWQKKFQVWGVWEEPVAGTPRDSTMPRGAMKQVYSYRKLVVPDWAILLKLDLASFTGDGHRLPEHGRKKLERRRLFSVVTRAYLRRRSWRYFRKLGRSHPERYITGVTKALCLYQDTDVSDGLALLDNWSLTHILFQFSPCLVFDDRTCHVADGHTLAELEPAPKYQKLWNMQPRAFVELLLKANCRAVRSWSVRMVRQNLAAMASLFTLDERLALLSDDDPDVVNLASDLLRDDPTLRAIPAERWFRVLEAASPTALEIVCELMSRLISPEALTLTQVVKSATARPLPIARMGFQWLQRKRPQNEHECHMLLAVGEAECESLRPEILRWATAVLLKSEWFQPDWVMEWLDSRNLDARTEGWAWFQRESRVRDDVTIWQRLMETPYDDVRIALVRELESRTQATDSRALSRGDLDPDLVRLLWASVLLNVVRGGRVKPVVMRQLVSRLEARPEETPRLLPLVSVAMRSVRGPEFRAGLAAVVRLAELHPSSVESIHREFPELRLT